MPLFMEAVLRPCSLCRGDTPPVQQLKIAGKSTIDYTRKGVLALDPATAMKTRSTKKALASELSGLIKQDSKDNHFCLSLTST